MRLVLGVAGHVDHGKTALVGALTGMQTDRLAEERARGISIVLGFAHLRLDGHDIDLIDMPGHERFVRVMVSGATGVDAMLLVVDAREGVMPQTREHAAIAALLGVRRAIVAVSRTDLATPDEADAAGRAALALARAAGLCAAEALPVSARTGAGLDSLRCAIAAEARAATPRADDGVAYLPVDRAFSRAGFGTVVTGTLRRGRLAAGGAVEIVPGGPVARIRGLQVHGADVCEAAPGQRVAVNLRGVAPGQVAPGDALATPGALSPSAWLSVQLRAVPGAPPLATTARLRLLFGTQEIDVRLRLLDREVLAQGESAPAQLHCAVPVGVPARERFILRGASPAVTLAGGLVLDPVARRERRHAPGVLSRLARLPEADAAAIVAGEVRGAGMEGVALARLARVAGVSEALAARLLPADDAVLTQGGTAVARPALDALQAVLPRVLTPHVSGLARETLAALVPRAGRAVLDEALDRLLAAGTIIREGAHLRVPRPAQDSRTADLARHMAAALEDTLRRAGLSPPDPEALAPDLARRRLVAQLVRQGIVVRAPDLVQKREILFHADAVADARRRLGILLAGGGMPVGEIGAALGISRKFSVPLLEYLDSVHFTRRVDERRVLADLA